MDIAAKMRLEITYDGMTLVRLYRDLTGVEVSHMGPMVPGNKLWLHTLNEDSIELEIAQAGYDHKSGLPLLIVKWDLDYDGLDDDGVGCVIRFLNLHGFEVRYYGEGDYPELPEEKMVPREGVEPSAP